MQSILGLAWDKIVGLGALYGRTEYTSTVVWDLSEGSVSDYRCFLGPFGRTWQVAIVRVAIVSHIPVIAEVS